VTPGGDHFAGDQLVALPQDVAALRVPEEHVVADVGEHHGRDLAGEGALVLGVAVLGTEAQRAPRSTSRTPTRWVKGGSTSTSTPAAVQLGPQGAANPVVSDGGVHLPVAGRPAGSDVGSSQRHLLLECGDPGQLLPLEVFESGATTGRNMADLVGDPGLVEGCGEVASATTLVAEEAPRASATRRVPRAKSSIS